MLSRPSLFEARTAAQFEARSVAQFEARSVAQFVAQFVARFGYAPLNDTACSTASCARSQRVTARSRAACVSS